MVVTRRGKGTHHQHKRELPLVLTPADVQKVLSVSRNTAYEVFRSKDFPCFRVGKQLRVSKERFIKWMEQQPEKAV